MPSIRYSFNQDYNPSDDKLANSGFLDINDNVDVHLINANGNPDAFVVDDVSAGTQKFLTDARGTGSLVNGTQFGVDIDFHDMLADCTLIGGSRGDSILGGAGDDTIVGNGGADTLLGGAGDDILNTDGGRDILTGGTGADTFKFTFNSGANARIASVHDMDATDTIDLMFGALNLGFANFTAVDRFDAHTGEIESNYNAGHDRTIFKFDFDGNGKADHRIVVLNGDYSDYAQVTRVDTSHLSSGPPAHHDLVV